MIARLSAPLLLVLCGILWSLPVPLDASLRVKLVGSDCCQNCVTEQVPCPTGCGVNATWRRMIRDGVGMRYFIINDKVLGCPQSPGIACPMNERKGAFGCVDDKSLDL